MRRFLVLVTAVGLLLLAAPNAALAQGVDELEIEVNRASFTTQLGGSFELVVTLVNNTQHQIGPLSAHLMIVDPDEAVALDPEDWVSEVAQVVHPVAAGESAVVAWKVKPITEGDYALLVTLFEATPGPGSVAGVSQVIPISISSPSADLGMALPVSIAVPFVLAAVISTQVSRRRRRQSAYEVRSSGA